MTVTVQSVIVSGLVEAQIVASTAADRTNPTVQEDLAPVANAIYLYLVDNDDITSVTWWMDEREYATRTTAPYDLGGVDGDGIPIGLQASSLTAGTHTVFATITTTDNRIGVDGYTFTVADGFRPETIQTSVAVHAPNITIAETDRTARPDPIARVAALPAPIVLAGSNDAALKAGVGVYANNTGGYAVADEWTERNWEAQRFVNRRVSYVREIIGRQTWAGFESNSRAILDVDAFGSNVERNPVPWTAHLTFPIFTGDSPNGGYGTPTARRANMIAVVAGDYDAHYDVFIAAAQVCGFGTTSPNLYLDVLHEFDGDGGAPWRIQGGNVDYAIAAGKYVSDYLRTNGLPFVRCGFSMMARAGETYYTDLAQTVASSRTRAEIFVDRLDFISNRDGWTPSAVFQFCSHNYYDKGAVDTNWATVDRRNRWAHENMARHYGIEFCISEWGCNIGTAQGSGQPADFVQHAYDLWNGYTNPVLHHHNYFEGRADCSLYQNLELRPGARRYQDLFASAGHTDVPLTGAWPELFA